MAKAAFAPMLAETCEDIEALTYPVIASPKLDGIRALVRDGVMVSRNLKPIRNKHVQAWVLAYSAELEGLDGELICGEHDATVFNRTTSNIMSAKGNDEFTYWVFDQVNNLHYRARIGTLRSNLNGAAAASRIKLVPTKTCNNADELRAFEEECLNRGFEGVMVRKPDGPYKQGRSTVKEGYLLKIKRFTDAEATVVGWEERMENHNEEKRDATGKINRSTALLGLVPAGDLGALLVRDSGGRHFKIGTGFTADQRVSIWAERNKLMGRLVKYKSFPQGVKDAPRFPVFLGWRHEDDM